MEKIEEKRRDMSLSQLTSSNMKITYDKEADAMYLYLQSGKKVARTVELADLLTADLDARGKVIGIEVLCASKQFGKRASGRKVKDFFSMTVPMPMA